MKNILLFINLLLPFVVFSQPGNSISPSSANAGQTLNVTITATSPKFTQGAHLTVTIAGAFSDSVTIINDLTIEANISIPANTYTNDYNVIVNQLNVGPLLVVNGFHINGIALPLLTSVSPSVATNGQTLDIMLTGKNTHFVSSGVATKVWINFGFSVGTEANSVTPINDTLIKANITVPVYIYDGYYTVSCYNSFNGSLSWSGIFQVTGNPRPKIAVSPANGIAGRTLDLTIIGIHTHFKSNKIAVNFGFNSVNGGSVINTITVLTDTTIKVNITIPASTVPSSYLLSVSDSNNTSTEIGNCSFYVNAGNTPLIVDVNPKSATAKQTLDVTITGANTHFTASGNSVTFGSSGTTIINSINTVNDSSLVVNMTIPYNIQAGDYNVSVSNIVDQMVTLNNGFHINQAPMSTISSINPNTANSGQTLDVTIKGVNTHFGTNNGTTVAFYFAHASGANTNTVNSINVLNDTTLTANITIPADVYYGDYDFSVKNTSDGPLPIYGHGFHVNGIPLPPAITADPGGILTGETANVTIRGTRGTHFNQPGSKTTVNFVGNRTIAINSKTVVNDSVIELNITTPAIAGGYYVFVNDSIDGQIKGFFKVYPKCHAFYTTTYNSSTNVFTLALDSATSQATSFHWDFGDGTTSTDSFPSHVFTEDKIYNVCLQITNAAGDSCVYCHEMGKDSLGNPIFKTKGFSIKAIPYKKPITGILSYDNDEHFLSVYPNPADDLITISSSTPINSLNKPVLSIYSIEGKLLLQQAFVKEKMTIDVSAFQKGMYIMQLTGSKQTEIIKFTKE